MEKINDGGPAFPIPVPPEIEVARGSMEFPFGHQGMTLRDWFAGQALAEAIRLHNDGYYDGGNDAIAKCAYQFADALIAARSGE